MTTLSLSRTTTDDGASIAWRTVGDGPDVVVLHGAMQSGESQRDLALLLAPHLRIHLVDRRGRGASTGDPATTTAREVADLRSVLDATQATNVFGVSSGAIIAARAALADSRIERLALFEPPISLDGSVRLELAPRLRAALAGGQLAEAMALGMKIAQMGPPWMFGLPTPLLALLSRSVLKKPESQRLARGLAADFAVVSENADSLTDFTAISVPTLLLDGTATRPYLRAATSGLASSIPGAVRVELPGQWHGTTQNVAERGHPDAVAPHLEAFFC